MSRRLDRKALILDGRPACGKGTQAKRLREFARKHGLSAVLLATGDVIRKINEGEGETATSPWDPALRELAPRVKAEMEKMLKGDLMSDNLIKEITEYLFSQIPTDLDADLIILDGVPRTDIQVNFVAQLLGDHGVKIDQNVYAVRLRVERDVCVARQIDRALKEGRPDDADPAIINNRQDRYESHQYLLREVMTRMGIHFMQLSVASDATIERVTGQIVDILPRGFFNPTHAHAPAHA